MIEAILYGLAIVAGTADLSDHSTRGESLTKLKQFALALLFALLASQFPFRTPLVRSLFAQLRIELKQSDFRTVPTSVTARLVHFRTIGYRLSFV